MNAVLQPTSAVNIFELTASDGIVEASIKRESLDSLKNLTLGHMPCMRLIEFNPNRLESGWTSAGRLRNKALTLLQTGLLADHLRSMFVKLAHVDVTGRWREVDSAVDAIKAQSRYPRYTILVEWSLPDQAKAEPVLEAWAKWLQLSEVAHRKTIVRDPPKTKPVSATAAANEVLSTLLANDELFLDSATVGRKITQNPTLANPKMTTSRRRKERRIFGVWDGNAYRYPVFQFDEDGQPRDAVPALIDVLPKDTDGTNRDAALWLFAPDLALGDRSPAEVFPEDPAAVIALARERLGVDDTQTLSATAGA